MVPGVEVGVVDAVVVKLVVSPSSACTMLTLQARKQIANDMFTTMMVEYSQEAR